ncbi:MAG: hypothetical protein Q9159_002470 [Coniocarpon cinnabarinum]
MSYPFELNHPALTIGFSVQFFVVYPQHSLSHLNRIPVRYTPEQFGLVSSRPPPKQPPVKSEDFARFALEQAFHKVGLPFENAAEAAFHPGLPPNFTTWCVKRGTHKLNPSERFAFDRAEVATGVNYCVAACELVSRKFCYHHEDWRAEIATAFAVLRGLETPTMALLTNGSTSFHVHIGLGGEHFSFESIKNLLLLSAAFERSFDALHPASRQHQPHIAPREDCKVSSDTYPLNWFAQYKNPSTKSTNSLKSFLYALNHSTPEDLRALFWIKPGKLPAHLGHDPEGTQLMARNSRIDITRVPCVFSAEHRLDRKIGEIQHDFCTGKETVEFRQHAATLQYKEVAAWLEVCARVVSVCAKDDPSTNDFIRRLIAKDLSNGHFTILDLLASLATDNITRQHYQEQLARSDSEVIYLERLQLASWISNNSPLAPLVRRTIVNRLQDSLPSVKQISGVERKEELGHYGIGMDDVAEFPYEKCLGMPPDVGKHIPGPGRQDDESAVDNDHEMIEYEDEDEEDDDEEDEEDEDEEVFQTAVGGSPALDEQQATLGQQWEQSREMNQQIPAMALQLCPGSNAQYEAWLVACCEERARQERHAERVWHWMDAMDEVESMFTAGVRDYEDSEVPIDA